MFVKDSEIAKIEEWVAEFDNTHLIEQIVMFDKILEFDNMTDFLFLDEIIQVYEIMRSECVKRIANLSPHV